VPVDKEHYTTDANGKSQPAQTFVPPEKQPYPAALRSVEAAVLFGHDGFRSLLFSFLMTCAHLDRPKEPQYTTSYNASWNLPRGSRPHAVSIPRVVKVTIAITIMIILFIHKLF
jgi:hypothetical protein